MTDYIRYSVVVPFKDWGLDRLTLNLSHLVSQVNASGGEVIVSDYGSENATRVESVASSLGAKYVYTHTDGLWSKSKAVNAGFAVSRGKLLVSTDADMLFSPTALPTIIESLESSRNSVVLLQCRDLPKRFDANSLTREVNWNLLERVSRLRPRYGMGGMIAFPRATYLKIRGLDERMSVYGGEDIDFAQRLQRAGLSIKWIDDNNARMYHVWHPSSRKASESTEITSIKVKENSRILIEDKSYIRNLRSWEFRPFDAKPIVTVVICTKDRVEFLSDAVYSVLLQTVSDIQVIVVDDGSTDETKAFLQSIVDPRLVILSQDHKGIAAARNYAAQFTEGEFTVIFDDDDIMLPDRIEKHLQALQGGDSGTYGGWIDFTDSGTETLKINRGREFTHDIVRVLGEVYLHPTLMIETRLIREILYDHTYRSGSDFNLAIKWFRSGIRLRHTGSILILRRLHERQVTSADSDFQQASWSITRGLGLFNISQPQNNFLRKREDRGYADVALDLEDARTLMSKWGPNSWASRKSGWIGAKDFLARSDSSEVSEIWRILDEKQRVKAGLWILNNPSWEQLWKIRTSSFQVLDEKEVLNIESAATHELVAQALKTFDSYDVRGGKEPRDIFTRLIARPHTNECQCNSPYISISDELYCISTQGTSELNLVQFAEQIDSSVVAALVVEERN